jgi:hypothetical protein
MNRAEKETNTHKSCPNKDSGEFFFFFLETESGYIA